jgi:hypothetical protein
MPLKRRSTSTRLQGAISQKAIVFILNSYFLPPNQQELHDSALNGTRFS